MDYCSSDASDDSNSSSRLTHDGRTMIATAMRYSL